MYNRFQQRLVEIDQKMARDGKIVYLEEEKANLLRYLDVIYDHVYGSPDSHCRSDSETIREAKCYARSLR